MRKYVLIAAAAAALTVSGCSTTTQTNVDNTISQVQQAAVRVCAFLPTAATVAGIIATLAGAGNVEQVIASVASQICAAVAPKPAGRFGAAPPSVNGVAVHGRFVSR